MLVADPNSRYHRQELITWWDQEKLAAARVMVVGAGAIGNEVVKNLGLVGVGKVDICDMDTIEHSNLARCVFFAEADEGQNKAEVLARAVTTLNGDVTATGHPVAVQRLGIGFLRNYDIVIGALDNREARAWVNQACRKLSIPWIDGAIEGLRGLVRIFGADGPCYACTLTEADYVQMSHRRSCALLAPEEILGGKTPTNATTAAIVAAIQTQEAIKYLTGNSDLVALVGKVWSYTGDTMNVFTSRYSEDEFCLAHDVYDEIVAAPSARTLADIALIAFESIGQIDALDFEEDIISLAPCGECGSGDAVMKVRSAYELGEGRCENTGNCSAQRVGDILTSLSAGDERLSMTLAALNLAQCDIISARAGNKRVCVLVGAAGG
jgi:adenylyltransferase/sulfurtransferase